MYKMLVRQKKSTISKKSSRPEKFNPLKSWFLAAKVSIDNHWSYFENELFDWKAYCFPENIPQNYSEKNFLIHMSSLLRPVILVISFLWDISSSSKDQFARGGWVSNHIW